MRAFGKSLGLEGEIRQQNCEQLKKLGSSCDWEQGNGYFGFEKFAAKAVLRKCLCAYTKRPDLPWADH